MERQRKSKSTNDPQESTGLLGIHPSNLSPESFYSKHSRVWHDDSATIQEMEAHCGKHTLALCGSVADPRPD